jgi:hypothetical protein
LDKTVGGIAGGEYNWVGCCWFSGHPLTLIRPAFRTPWD